MCLPNGAMLIFNDGKCATKQQVDIVCAVVDDKGTTKCWQPIECDKVTTDHDSVERQREKSDDMR